MVHGDSRKKRKRDHSGSQSDDNATDDTRNPKCSKHTSAIKSREAECDNIVSELRERYGTTYSAIQYCLWAEMKIGHTWDSLEKAPPHPMFG